MKRIIVALLLFVLLGLPSCGILKGVGPTIEYQKDTIYIHNTDIQWEKDSIYIYNIVKEKGDTIFVTQLQYRDRWKTKIQIDTIYKEKEKEKIVTKIEEVEKPFTKWQKFLLNMGKVGIILIVILLCFGAYKLYRKIF